MEKKQYYGFDGNGFIDLGEHKTIVGAFEISEKMKDQGELIWYVADEDKWTSIFKDGLQLMGK